MHDRCVVTATKTPPNIRQRALGEFFTQIHGDLARAGNIARAAFGRHVIMGDGKFFGHGALNLIHSEAHTFGIARFRERLLNSLERDRCTKQFRLGDDLVKRTFKVARGRVNARSQMIARKRDKI